MGSVLPGHQGISIYILYLLVLQKKRTIDDESNFCTEETLRDVLNSKVMYMTQSFLTPNFNVFHLDYRYFLFLRYGEIQMILLMCQKYKCSICHMYCSLYVLFNLYIPKDVHVVQSMWLSVCTTRTLTRMCWFVGWPGSLLLTIVFLLSLV